jgi:hypothetical protein
MAFSMTIKAPDRLFFFAVLILLGWCAVSNSKKFLVDLSFRISTWREFHVLNSLAIAAMIFGSTR